MKTSKKINLQGISLVELFGAKNKNLHLIRSFFPLLKISSRGTILSFSGDSEIAEEFEKKIQLLIRYFLKKGEINENIIESIFLGHLDEIHDQDFNDSDVILHGVGGAKIKARTVNQQRLTQEINKNDLVFAIGPAGTGKTYTAVAMAVKALKNKEVKRIVLTRPAVEAGENLGFLPGDLKEKLDPYLMPLYDALRDMIPNVKLAEMIEQGIIEIAPLAFMRGRTLDKAFVILDEAQNSTLVQLKMFLTRMGKTAKFVITGDMSQIDLPSKQKSGLGTVIDLLNDIEGIGMIRMTKTDVIRHSLVKSIVEKFEFYHQKEA